MTYFAGKKRWYGFILISGAVLLVFSVYFSYRYYQDQVSDYQNQYTARLVSALQQEIRQQLFALYMLQTFLEESNYLDLPPQKAEVRHAAFARNARRILSIFPNLKALEYTSPEFIIREVFPLQGNEAALGLDIRKHPDARAVEPALNAVKYAELDTTIVALSLPFQLAQGGLGMTGFLPVKKNGKLRGFAEIVYDLDAIGQRVLSVLNPDHFGYRIYAKDTSQVIWRSGSLRGPVVKRALQIGDKQWIAEVYLSQDPFFSGFLYHTVFVALAVMLITGLALVLYRNSVTERQRLAQMVAQRTRELDRQRSYFKTLLDHSPVAIAIVDEDGRVERANRYFGELFGVDPEEIKNALLESQIVPEDLVGEARQLHERALQGEKLQVETWRRHASGKLCHVSLILAPVHLGDKKRVYHIYQDITERKKMENALRESERQYRELTESMNDAIYIVQDEKFVYVNPRFTEILGYSLEELQEKKLHIMDLVAPQSRPLVYERIQRRMRGEKVPPIYRFTALTKSGRHIEVEVSLADIEWQGKPAVQGILRDVTEMVRIQEQLQNFQKLEAVGKLAGGIAHDFNNMLMVILGNCELALQAENLDLQVRSAIQEIRKAADRAAKLTRQLLAYSRKQVLRRQPHDINQILRGIRQMIGSLLGEKIRCEYLLAEDLPPVSVDAHQIEQVVINLCLNARDAIEMWEEVPGGETRAHQGKVVFETRQVELGEEYVRNHAGVRPGKYVLLSISDNGVGIPPEHLDKIFDPFYTTKPVDKGTGLGLSSVYGTVKQHGGYIWVYSEAKKGTTFKIYLPVEEAAPESVGGKRGKETGAVRSKARILLVEDEPKVRAMVARMLRGMGHMVKEVEKPFAALDLVRSSSEGFDILITDLVMPELSGRNLSELARREFPQMKVILMSGYTENGMKWVGDLPPGTFFLSKPFTLEELRSAINAALFGI